MTSFWWINAQQKSDENRINGGGGQRKQDKTCDGLNGVGKKSGKVNLN